jgi:hypothetical protein
VLRVVSAKGREVLEEKTTAINAARIVRAKGQAFFIFGRILCRLALSSGSVSAAADRRYSYGCCVRHVLQSLSHATQTI